MSNFFVNAVEGKYMFDSVQLSVHGHLYIDLQRQS